MSIENCNSESSIRIFDDQRLPHLDTYKQRIMKLRKENKGTTTPSQIKPPGKGKDIENWLIVKRYLRELLKNDGFGEKSRINGEGRMGGNSSGMIPVSVRQKMVALLLGRWSPCIHREWQPLGHFDRHLGVLRGNSDGRGRRKWNYEP